METSTMSALKQVLICTPLGRSKTLTTVVKWKMAEKIPKPTAQPRYPASRAAMGTAMAADEISTSPPTA